MKPVCEPASAVQSPVHPWKSPTNLARSSLHVLALGGSALPWLVNDRAALRLHRIWCVPYRLLAIRADLKLSVSVDHVPALKSHEPRGIGVDEALVVWSLGGK